MNIAFFVRGLVIGFSIAATVGPMSTLCIQRTIHKGFLAGLISGLGIASADGCYGSIAAFGITVVTTLLIRLQLWIHVIGGLFLIYLGIRTLLTPPAERAARAKATNLSSMYLSTFLLTLTNPLTIISFAAIFAGIGIGINSTSASVLVVAGVFLGSTLWWIILTSSLSILRIKLAPMWLHWINRVSGIIILLFGIFALLSFVR